MKNPFLYCKGSECTDATNAVSYWTLGYHALEEAGLGTELALVYFEWLDEYCAWDLGGQK